MEIQLSFFDAIIDILSLTPIFILGLALIGLSLFWLFRRDKKLLKFIIVIESMLMYYYICVVLKNIVGIPTIKEFVRLLNLGESLFNPQINLIPFINGIGLEFILNIFCFIPLGFLSPMISKAYEKMQKVVLLGLGLSFAIEASQLFTLYRASDINDLIANVVGAIIGYFCFRFVVKQRVIGRFFKHNLFLAKDPSRFIPILIVVVASVFTFIS